MTRYELKDKDKQAKYLAVFPDFLTALTNAMNHREPDERWIRVQSGEYEYSVNVYPEEVEAFAEYDPYKWNVYPNVTPPEKVWMRIEMISQDGRIKTRDVAFYRAGRWCKFPLDNGEVILGRLRFRPWDEEAAK